MIAERPPAARTIRSNQPIGDRLREAADLLEQQAANPFRVRAYREAAQTVAGLPDDVAEIYERHGAEGLEALPGIGPRIAAAIAEMLRTGRWSQLERLRGALDAEKLFRGIPGVGPALARRIHDTLHVDTLQALEVAAHDGRLAAVSGIGPRRFNPSGQAWLPVLHTERDHWQITALFSNTGRAHELGKTRDWVVIYFHTDTQAEGQRTVVTETHGALAGRRVVRGREEECRAYYDGLPRNPAPAAAGSSAASGR